MEKDHSWTGTTGWPALFGLAIVLVGSLYFLFLQISKKSTTVGIPVHGWRIGGSLALAVLLCSAPGLLFLSGHWGWLRAMEAAHAQSPTGYLLFCAIPIPVCLALMQLFLPRWWISVLACDKVLRMIQARPEDGKSAGIPGLESVGFLVQLLMPKSAIQSNLKDMEIPFLEQEAKRLVRTLVRYFGRVVILIDDVDALPENKIFEVYRVLRPLSKVPGAVTVVGVPLCHYTTFIRKKASDLHSTVTDIHLLASPLLQFVDKHLNAKGRSEIFSAIHDVLASRLVLPCRENFEKVLFLQALASPWNTAESIRWADYHEGSIRELLRQVRAILDGEPALTIGSDDTVETGDDQRDLEYIPGINTTTSNPKKHAPSSGNVQRKKPPLQDILARAELDFNKALNKFMFNSGKNTSMAEINHRRSED